MKLVRLILVLLIFVLVVIPGMSGCSHDSDEVTEREIFVDHYKSECSGFDLSLCMRSRSGTEDEWSPFYETIEGFDYEWGYVYKLRVTVSTIKNPPEDGSSKRYELVEILSKTLESSDTLFDIAASRSPGLVVKKTTGIYELYGEKEFSCSIQDCATIESVITQDLAILFEFTHNSTLSEPMQLRQIKCSASRGSFNASCL